MKVKPQSLTVVLPVFNEREGLIAAVEAVRAAAADLVASGEIDSYGLLLVDDGSTDGSSEMIDQLVREEPWVRAVHHDRNRGLGAAIKSGLQAAEGDLVLYTDADLPFDLGELAKACRLLRVYEADVVSAFRHDRTAEGPRRAVYSFAYNHLIRWVFGLRLRDVNFAFKLIRREVLDAVRLRSEGSFIDAELLIRAERAGFATVQFGVDYFPRRRGVSTLSSGSTIATIVREMATLRGDVLTPRVQVPDGTLLIVNADDYGLTEGISRGILRGHAEGIVTSTSVLALGPAFDAAAPWLAEAPDLGIGAHLAVVGEDPPLLSAREIPSLVDRRGRLAASWRHLLPRLAAGRIDPEDLRREFTAQLERVLAIGRPLTHLDTHQHLHLWPSVADVVLDLASTHGIPAVRIPRARHAGPVPVAMNGLAKGLQRRADAAGRSYVGATAGFDESGRMDVDALVRALDGLAASGVDAAELLVHPGEAEDPARHRYEWGYRWSAELDALTAPAARAAVERHDFRLGTYADLRRS